MKNKLLQSFTTIVLTSLIAVVLSLPDSARAGSIVSWGADDPYDPDYWGLVSDTPADCNTPAECGFTAVAAGGSYSLALRADGSIVSWGCDNFGQVSNTPTPTDCNTPSECAFIAIDGGWGHGLALGGDGSIVSWGRDDYGQVSDTPAGSDFIAIAAGINHSLALGGDGSIVSWGRDDYGQVSDTPAETGFIAIASGGWNNFALRGNGTIVSWGPDYYGVVSDTPTETGFTAIAGGCSHGLALRADGSIVSWGCDGGCFDYGQVSDTPTGSGFIAIAGGCNHSLAISSDGSLIAWGGNFYGQCNVPEGYDFVDIGAGEYHSLALTLGVTVTLTVQTDPNDMDTVIPGIGEHIYRFGKPVYISAPPCPKCPDVYEFDHWTGDIDEPNSPSAYLIMNTDKTITAAYKMAIERRCGDECHPILQGDVNEDCYINLEDFILYAANWLSCTHPDCD